MLDRGSLLSEQSLRKVMLQLSYRSVMQVQSYDHTPVPRMACVFIADQVAVG